MALKSALKVTLLSLFISCSILFDLHSQNENKLHSTADVLEGGVKDGVSFKKLIGNVVFTQGQTTIYCDSALAYDKTNSMEAFGRVRIEDMQDSVNITSDRLNYDGDGRTAKLRGNVVYVDDSIRLNTENLDYDMLNKSAVYFDGGTIFSGVNTITSKKGNYDTEGKLMIFTDSVEMVTPDYTLQTNNLVYNMITKIAKSSSETKITTKEGRVLMSKQGSEFDTSKNTSVFMMGEVNTDKYYLRGDELYFDNVTGSYEAKGNVYLHAKEDDVIITGQQANFWQDQGRALIVGEPLLKKPLNEDTLYLRADTLISINDSLETNKRLLAYPHVKIYKADVQGKADSLAYLLSDSLMVFYRDPILWNEGSQITADTIEITVKNGTIDQLRAKTGAFIISQDSTTNFNQVKGRQMIAYFIGKSVDFVNVTGNGESIYFVADDEDVQKFIGMNKIACSNMKIAFAENQVNDILFFTKPDGSFTPPHELKEEDTKLEGFSWRIDERPTRGELLTNPAELERVRQEHEKFIQENLPELNDGSKDEEGILEKPESDKDAAMKPENQ